MGKKEPDNYLIVEHEKLGTMTLEELQQALWSDIAGMKEMLNIGYVTGAKLIIPITNDHGDPLPRTQFCSRKNIDSYHYKPACKDYGL